MRFYCKGLRDFAHAALDRLRCDRTHAQRKRKILEDAHVRKKRVVLKDERYAPARGTHRQQVGPVERDAARVRLLQPGENPQKRGFPCTARPENNEQFTVCYGKRNAVERDSTASCIAIGFEKTSGYE